MPETSIIFTPADTRSEATSLLMPAPVSLTIMGTGPFAADLIASSTPAPSLSPSGCMLSCRKLRCIAMASASIISASFSIISGPLLLSCTAPMLPITGTSGAASLTTEKVSSRALSSRAALCEPTPMAMPVSEAAWPRRRLISLVAGWPPVMAQIMSGAASSFPKKRQVVSISISSISGRAL